MVLYCSKDCQRAHWKANHKQYCVAKANRAPQSQNSSGSHETADSNAASKWEKCAICQDALSDVSACILPCTHVYHASCVAELRKFGVKQACPLCRTPLPPGPEKVFDEATRRYMVLSQLVERGYESWSDLPASSQRELDAVLTGWRAVADQGHADAQAAQVNLGIMFEKGRGVAQSDKEAVRWYNKAADQGLAAAQVNLGLMFEEGRGVAQNDKEAVRWYKKSAEQGGAAAQANLGNMFGYGRGVVN